MTDEIDQPPASDNDGVQTFLDVQWREATRAARDGMESLRAIWPELVEQVNETAGNQLKDALHEFERAYRFLHQAGPHILGADEYARYIEALTARQIGG